jgi:hypothetical protein
MCVIKMINEKSKRLPAVSSAFATQICTPLERKSHLFQAHISIIFHYDFSQVTAICKAGA